MSNETLGASFSLDISELKAGINEANRLIRASETQFREAAAGMDDWTESQEGLEARQKSLNKQIDLQQGKIENLVKQRKLTIAQMEKEGKSAAEIAKATDSINQSITRESKQLDKLKGELKKTEKAMDNLSDETKDADKKLKDAGDSAKDAGGKFSGLKAAAGVAVGAIAAVGAACIAAVGGFLGLAGATRDYRRDMAAFTQNADKAGVSLDDMKAKLQEVGAVTGDADAALEGMNMLMATGLDTSQIELAADALTGAATKFDGLKFEAMAEGLQETLATGVAVGPFSELIERTGGDLEAFNEGLAKCTTEAQKQAYAMQFLTESGLIEANKEYKEVNKHLVEAAEAEARMTEATATLGAIAEPIMTKLQNLAADLLTTITPFVQLIGDGITGALNGTQGAAESLASGLGGIVTTAVEKIGSMLPFAVQTIVAIVPQLLSSLTAQLPLIFESLLGMVEQVTSNLLPVLLGQLPSILETLMTMVAQVAVKLGEMLPTLIPVIINAVLMVAETLLDNVGMLIDAGISLLVGLADGLIAALPQLIDKIPVIIEKAISAITQNLPKLVSAGIQLTIKLAVGLIKAIPQLISKVPQIIKSIVTELLSYVSDMSGVGEDLIEGLWNGIADMTGWITEKLNGFGESVLGGIRRFFGIESPSKVMADVVGKNLALGIGKGFEDNIGEVNKDIENAFNIKPIPVQFAANNGAGGLASRSPGGVVVNQYNTYSQAHSRYEIWQSQQDTAAAVKLALMGG